MAILDKIESMYTRVQSKARLYDGTIVDCAVYSDAEKKLPRDGENKPPTERYIDIMIEGATKYGVNPEYIDKIRKLEC